MERKARAVCAQQDDQNIPVQRHCCQSKDARVHGQVDDKVHSFAHEGSKYPLVHCVDGSLERHAEDDEAEVRQTEVQDEQVGALCVHLPVADENCEHKTVPHGTNQKNDREYDRNDYRLNFPVRGEVNLLRCVHLSCK